MTKVDPRELEARELDALIAVRLFGWEWLERDSGGRLNQARKAIFPPENSGWVRVNFSPQVFRPAQGETQRFSDWDQCCRTEDTSQRGLPRYSTDIACAFQVEDRIAELELIPKYIEALRLSVAVTRTGMTMAWDVWLDWRIAHATPRQRCQAALTASSTTPEETKRALGDHPKRPEVS